MNPDPAQAAIALTDCQLFEIERFSRDIDATMDLAALKGICKQLLRTWMAQRAATAWVMRNGALPQQPMAPWDDPLL